MTCALSFIEGEDRKQSFGENRQFHPQCITAVPQECSKRRRRLANAGDFGAAMAAASGKGRDSGIRLPLSKRF
jgi:hypothetical protein